MSRRPKYDTAQIATWKCGECDFLWYYKTIKCPLCYSDNTVKIN
ncbi:MAG: hypothetical protein V1870_01505 [Candidatus Aenigmatarchaeota archaeon]